MLLDNCAVPLYLLPFTLGLTVAPGGSDLETHRGTRPAFGRRSVNGELGNFFVSFLGLLSIYPCAAQRRRDAEAQHQGREVRVVRQRQPGREAAL